MIDNLKIHDLILLMKYFMKINNRPYNHTSDMLDIDFHEFIDWTTNIDKNKLLQKLRFMDL